MSTAVLERNKVDVISISFVQPVLANALQILSICAVDYDGRNGDRCKSFQTIFADDTIKCMSLHGSYVRVFVSSLQLESLLLV